jgi:hypothetical protein
MQTMTCDNDVFTQVNDQGTWVSAEVDFATQRVPLDVRMFGGGSDADGDGSAAAGAGAEEQQQQETMWISGGGDASLRAGHVLERDARTGQPKTTVEGSVNVVCVAAASHVHLLLLLLLLLLRWCCCWHGCMLWRWLGQTSAAANCIRLRPTRARILPSPQRSSNTTTKPASPPRAA